MATNEHGWNVTLKFSWGHIITFVALIFILYIDFMGEFYASGGNFVRALLVAGAAIVLLCVVFLGAQMQKSASRKFDRHIKIERVLIALTPIVLAVAMIPLNHFWTVYGQRHEIVEEFNGSISDARGMFDAYNDYANQRIDNYSRVLRQAVDSGNAASAAIVTTYPDTVQRANAVAILRAQLLSRNTDSLRTIANTWIDEAQEGASVWNAFLIGNMGEIRSAIQDWHGTLVRFSGKQLLGEDALGNQVTSFDPDETTINSAITRLDALGNRYKERHGLEWPTLVCYVVLYMMLIFPYLLQRRNERARGYQYLLPFLHKKKAVAPVRDTIFVETPVVMPHPADTPPPFGGDTSTTMPPASQPPRPSTPPSSGGSIYDGTL